MNRISFDSLPIAERVQNSLIPLYTEYFILFAPPPFQNLWNRFALTDNHWGKACQPCSMLKPYLVTGLRESVDFSKKITAVWEEKFSRITNFGATYKFKDTLKRLYFNSQDKYHSHNLIINWKRHKFNLSYAYQGYCKAGALRSCGYLGLNLKKWGVLTNSVKAVKKMKITLYCISLTNPTTVFQK